MAFDGSGNYVTLVAPTFPAVSGTSIVASYYNAQINDIAAGLSLCITRDGQGKPSANIDWNAKNLTNVATFAAVNASFTNALPVASGGTGSVTVPANGQLLIGNGAGYSTALPSGSGGITVTGGSGTLAFSLAGAYTAAGLTINTSKLLGRTTAASGAAEEIAIGAGLSLVGGVLAATGGAAALAKLTMNNSGSGDASGAQYDGTVVKTISWNSIGAQPSTPQILSVASSGTVTMTSAYDGARITAQAANLTLANPTGTFNEMQGFIIRIKDNGTSRNINFGGKFRAVGVTLPSATVSNRQLYLGVVYNETDDKFDVVLVGQQ